MSNITEATPLDDFQPKGEPIHPFDFCELLENAGVRLAIINNRVTFPKSILIIGESPRPLDAGDYFRNIKKSGRIVQFAGKLYFETTTVPSKNKNFVAKGEEYCV
jgi:hypothetical protein